MAESHVLYAIEIHVRFTISNTACNHMSDCSVQCTVGTIKREMTVTVGIVEVTSMESLAYKVPWVSLPKAAFLVVTNKIKHRN